MNSTSTLIYLSKQNIYHETHAPLAHYIVRREKASELVPSPTPPFSLFKKNYKECNSEVINTTSESICFNDSGLQICGLNTI